MNNTIPPHTVLSKIEDNRCNHLLAELAALKTERGRLTAKLEATVLRYEDINDRRQKNLGHSVKAAEIAVLEAACSEEAARKSEILCQLNILSNKEKQLKAEILACMGKSKAYEQLQKKKETLQKRLTSHADQQAIDDLMARRSIQGH